MLNNNDLIPENCPVCCSLLEIKGVHLVCNNYLCPEQQLQKIVYYCKKAEMDNISEATLRLLFDSGWVDEIRELYVLDKYAVKIELLKLNGMGESKFENLLKQVEKSRVCTFSELLVRLGIESVGKKALKKNYVVSYQERLMKPYAY